MSNASPSAARASQGAPLTPERSPGGVLNALTIDVEDWFHILDAQGAPSRDQWDALPSRLEANMDRLLELLDAASVRATFFWLGWAAERHPEVVRRCQRAGHEVASHGDDHLLAYQVGRATFTDDARRSRQRLEDITGAPVRGYRVAGFSFTPETPWAHEALAEAGYAYSSSTFPAPRGHGGFVGADTRRHPVETPAGTVWEVPITTIGLGRARVCLFGGGYFRVTPWPALITAARALNWRGEPVVFYLHPRELDPDQPRMRRLPLRRYAKYYVNLRGTEIKLRRVLATLPFAPLGEALDGVF